MKQLLVLLSALLLSQSALASVEACVANETRKPIFIVSQLSDNYLYSNKIEANSWGTTPLHMSRKPVPDLQSMRVCDDEKCEKVFYTMDSNFISNWNDKKYKSENKKYFVKVSSVKGPKLPAVKIPKKTTVSISDGWCPQ